MSEKTTVSVHGCNSDVEFEYDPENKRMLMIKAMVFVDATRPQCVNSEIGVTLSNEDIDDLIELLQKMKV